jgi:hypothetical protein
MAPRVRGVPGDPATSIKRFRAIRVLEVGAIRVRERRQHVEALHGSRILGVALPRGRPIRITQRGTSCPTTATPLSPSCIGFVSGTSSTPGTPGAPAREVAVGRPARARAR